MGPTRAPTARSAQRRWGAPIGSAPVALPDTQPERASSASAPRSPGPTSPAPVGLPPLHPDLPPRWPSVVRSALVRRHAELLDAVAGVPADRVLDLSLPAGRQVLAETLASVASPAGAGDAGAFDVVLSVAGLTRFPDLGAALAAVASLLIPSGALLAVEPDHRPGVTGLAVSSLGALLPPARGAHLARDVPVTVRSVGFTITDLRRVALPTMVWPLRTFVDFRATRLVVDDSSGDDEGGTP